MLPVQRELDPRYKIFHELMAHKVNLVLLVSTPYDAWILEKDQPLVERIIHEYRGLNLSRPPRIIWTSSASSALEEIEKNDFDLVITMPRLVDMDAFKLGQKIKAKKPGLAVLMLSQTPLISPECHLDGLQPEGVDATYIWTGNPDILVAMIKSVEDRVNVGPDTANAGIRVILFVEDSPSYISSLLPILYRELVLQTQAVIEHGHTEEHRLLAMRARPKILQARSYEEALELYGRYRPYILGVISDVRFSRACEPDGDAGVDLLRHIHGDQFDVPLLLISSEPANRARADAIPAVFVDKNSPSLQDEVREFVQRRLGFGEFIFRDGEGQELARAANLKEFEKALNTVPDDSLKGHCQNNDLSRWLFARTEIELASNLRCLTGDDFETLQAQREHLIKEVRDTRLARRKGAIVDFEPDDFDAGTEFAKIGKGSMGGKARGLTFFGSLLQQSPWLFEKYPEVDISIPQTVILTTEAFDEFVAANDLRGLAKQEASDALIAQRFLAAQLPAWVEDAFSAFLKAAKYPLAVRSSSLLEDAQFQAYAGLYSTYMLPNSASRLEDRLDQLLAAVKLVFASTYYQNPRDFSRRVGNRIEEEKMAVVIQKASGSSYNGFFYPAISGVALSHNYYPLAKMKPGDGIAIIALGLGKTVMEGDRALRFSPKHPEVAVQMGALDDYLKTAQRYFYALKLKDQARPLAMSDDATLARREVLQAADEYAVRLLCSTYAPEEDRLYDGRAHNGYPVLTFASVLKHGLVPLGRIISDVLNVGKEGMGCPVEVEFSLNLPPSQGQPPEFCILQLRPMSAREEVREVDISQEEERAAFLVSGQSLGNSITTDLEDIVYVDPEGFAPEKTRQIAEEIGELNQGLLKQGRKYLLIGPGRWGSSDRWLGIPVQWSDISGVGVMVETQFDKLKADPSQGSHFFHNITTLGIDYLTVTGGPGDRIDWDYLKNLPEARRTRYVRQVRMQSPMVLKVDGRGGRGVAIAPKA